MMRYLVRYLALALLTSTAHVFAAPADTNSVTPSLEKDVDVGGRTLHLATYGHGSPTVVVDAGLGEPAIESGTWKAVVASVSQSTTICLYDRAGLGKSGPVTNTVRTTEDVVRDLHTLLVNAKIAPPYILVGHSFGGFTVRLYAGRYPAEVAGIVLVDSSHPDQRSKLLAALPPESPSEPEDIKKARAYFSQMGDPTNNSEHLDLVASARQVSAVTNLGSIPLIVLTHSPKSPAGLGLPEDLRTKMDLVWQGLQDNLCLLSTQSTHKIASKASHYIHREEPQLVIDAILKLVDAAKSKAR